MCSLCLSVYRDESILSSSRFRVWCLERKCFAATQAKILGNFPKCADPLKITMAFLCANVQMYPSPFVTGNGRHFFCHARRALGTSCAQASFKYTRRPAILLGSVPELPLIIPGILTVSNHYQRSLHGGGVGTVPSSTSLEASSSHEFVQPEVADWLEM